MTPLALPNPWGGSCWFVETAGSTMSLALELEARGEPSGTLVQAGEQTEGLGRHVGRRWESPRGSSLAFTVFWRSEALRPHPLSISLRLGLGVCRWLESLPWAVGPSVSLKWPNDLYLNGRKVGGILVRRRLPFETGSVHAGLGINLGQREFKGDYRHTPTSLAAEGLALESGKALEGLLPLLAQSLEEVQAREACEKRLWKLGDCLEVVAPGGNPVKGQVVGLTQEGKLILETPSGQLELSSGE